jgi:hypothetical protein
MLGKRGRQAALSLTGFCASEIHRRTPGPQPDVQVGAARQERGPRGNQGHLGQTSTAEAIDKCFWETSGFESMYIKKGKSAFDKRIKRIISGFFS